MVASFAFSLLQAEKSAHSCQQFFARDRLREIPVSGF
jgi:hypothetical protein